MQEDKKPPFSQHCNFSREFYSFLIVVQTRGITPVVRFDLASGHTDKNWFDSVEGALFYRPATVCRSFSYA